MREAIFHLPMQPSHGRTTLTWQENLLRQAYVSKRANTTEFLQMFMLKWGSDTYVLMCQH